MQFLKNEPAKIFKYVYFLFILSVKFNRVDKSEEQLI